MWSQSAVGVRMRHACGVLFFKPCMTDIHLHIFCARRHDLLLAAPRRYGGRVLPARQLPGQERGQVGGEQVGAQHPLQRHVMNAENM
eukprot:COSAG05_NODE_989_length_6277_cov_12.365167_2_plen_87_part_00